MSHEHPYNEEFLMELFDPVEHREKPRWGNTSTCFYNKLQEKCNLII